MIDRRPQKRDDKIRKRITWAASIVMTLLVIFLVKLNFNDILSDILGAAYSVFVPASIALFVAYLMYPLYKRINSRIKRPNQAAVLTIIIFFIILLSILSLIGWLVADQAINIISKIDQDAIDELIVKINSMITFLPPQLYESITNELGELDFNRILSLLSESTNINLFIQGIILKALNGVKTALYSLISIIMMPVFLFFFLRDSGRIFNAFIKVIPKRFYKNDIRETLLIANSSTEKYIRAKMISIGFLSIFFSITFAVSFYFVDGISLGMAIAYGFIFGIILSLLDLVPYVGPAIGVIMPILFLLVVSSSGIQFVVFSIIILIVDGLGQSAQKMLIEPYVMSKEVEIHPLAIFSGMLFFGTLFGFVGLVIATPIVATIRNSYRYLTEKSELYKDDD